VAVNAARASGEIKRLAGLDYPLWRPRERAAR
jgi:hypothetical protein